MNENLMAVPIDRKYIFGKKETKTDIKARKRDTNKFLTIPTCGGKERTTH